MLLKIAALTVFIVLVAGGVALWLFPEVRTQALEWVSPWLRAIPGVEKFLGTEMKSRETSQTPVRIKDVRQRSVTNLLVGDPPRDRGNCRKPVIRTPGEYPGPPGDLRCL